MELKGNVLCELLILVADEDYWSIIGRTALFHDWQNFLFHH